MSGISAALLLLFWVGPLHAEQMQPEAVDILNRMFKAYASTPAFSCEGSCDDHEDGSTLPPDHRTVSLRFVRPDRFRLTWTQKDFHGKSGTSVIYSQAGRVYFREQGSRGDPEPEPTLAQAISSCAGISLGLSYLVPALLFEDPGYLKFVTLQKEADARSSDGRECWRLSGQSAEGAQWDLLIDRETFALCEAAEVNLLAPVTARQMRDAETKEHAAVPTLPVPPPRAIRTQYRFTKIQFTDTLPDNAFASPASRKKHR